MSLMYWTFSLPMALLVAACGTPPNEVVQQRDGSLRAPTYQQATAHCDKTRTSMVTLGRAPAEQGVLFRCE
jgi:hypothetical protein